jgi:hypothetical protein
LNPEASFLTEWHTGVQKALIAHRPQVSKPKGVQKALIAHRPHVSEPDGV